MPSPYKGISVNPNFIICSVLYRTVLKIDSLFRKNSIFPGGERLRIREFCCKMILYHIMESYALWII